MHTTPTIINTKVKNRHKQNAVTQGQHYTLDSHVQLNQTNNNRHWQTITFNHTAQKSLTIITSKWSMQI